MYNVYQELYQYEINEVKLQAKVQITQEHGKFKFKNTE